jgi:uncharacterized short protein YbdD (DUF466 family)
MTRLLTALRQIAGMPDYERYLAHRKAVHPEEPVLTEREFYDRHLEWRYAGTGSRCC